MKSFTILLLILTISAFLLLPRISSFLNPQETYGSLKVESVPNSVSVFVDDKEIGVTPLKGISVEAGIRKIKLVRNGVNWEGKIEVSAGTETFVKRILGPGDNFSGGSIVSYQKTKNGSTSPSLAITAEPEGVEVFINEKEYQVPVVLDKTLAGQHKLKFVLEGYSKEEIEVEVKNGFLTNVDVEMMVKPFGEVGEKQIERLITEGTEGNKEGTEGLEIRKRSEWGGATWDISKEETFFASWQKIEVYPIVYTKNLNWTNDINELLRGMDFYAREFLGLPALPFAYLVTENGEMYEGFGVRDFDFSKISNQQSSATGGSAISNQQFSPGVCPVAYLGTFPALTDEAKDSLSKLRFYLAGPPRQNAKLVTLLNPITIEPGNTREVTLEFQNMGEVTWTTFAKASVGGRVFLVTVPFKRASQFYTKDSWIAVDTIALPQEEKVLPGQTAKFIFSLTAPFYPAEISEDLGLLIEGTGKIINGSEVSLPISIWAEGLVAVEIKETPTGFLNVRAGPSTYAELVGTVYPGEKYLYLAEEVGFYKIKLRDGSEGWIYAKYVEKLG